MKQIIFTLSFLFFLFINNLTAQDSKGAITDEMLQQVRATYKNTPEDKAVTNAVTHNEIKKLAVNRENDGKINHLFSNKIETKAITNQKKSGIYRIEHFAATGYQEI